VFKRCRALRCATMVIAISSIRFAVPSCRRIGSRTFGATDSTPTAPRPHHHRHRAQRTDRDHPVSGGEPYYAPTARVPGPACFCLISPSVKGDPHFWRGVLLRERHDATRVFFRKFFRGTRFCSFGPIALRPAPCRASFPRIPKKIFRKAAASLAHAPDRQRRRAGAASGSGAPRTVYGPARARTASPTSRSSSAFATPFSRMNWSQKSRAAMNTWSAGTLFSSSTK
jgi:hypothetical protein